MAITIHLPTVLRRLADGHESLRVEGTTVREAVEQLASRFPELGQRLRDAKGAPYEYVTFYLNDEDIRLSGGFDAAVRDGDELSVIPALAGG